MRAELTCDLPILSSSADLSQTGDAEDKPFQFVLCHEGMNRNGDFFTAEELQRAYPSIVNKKINLKHSQDIPDVVGAVVSSNLVTDKAGMRVEAVGHLFTKASSYGALAY